MSKFKIGDRVENKVYGKGTVVEADNSGILVEYDKTDCSLHSGSSSGREHKEDSCWWYSYPIKNLKLVEQQFTKSNLQNGDIVTYRDGQKRTVMCNKLINEDGTATNYLTIYKDDLTYKNSQRDIVKVERSIGYETIFERKEEILDEVEKRYLASVIRPFRDEVEYIVKNQNIDGEFIHIELDGDSLNFPYLRDETMYKRMKPDKRYTLEELGL